MSVQQSRQLSPSNWLEQRSFLNSKPGTLKGIKNKIVLERCFYCRGEVFYVDLNADESGLLLGCCSCENKVEIAVGRVEGFCVISWKDVNLRNDMYRKLMPLYQYWNKANASPLK